MAGAPADDGAPREEDAAVRPEAAAEGGAGEAEAEESAEAEAEAEAGEEEAEAGEEEAEEEGAGAGGGLEGAESQQQSERDAGNEAYNQGKYEEAVKAWHRSLTSARYILNKGFYSKKPEQEEEVRAMELRLCLNMSQGYLKTRDWANAVTYADKVLEREPAHPKALYRKASALMQQQSFREALAVLEHLLQVEPQNKAALAMAAEARRSAQASDRRARRVSQKMFAALSEGRDPRVPPTRREALLAAARELWAGALRLLCDLPRLCRELASPRGVRGLLDSARRWLSGAGTEKKDS